MPKMSAEELATFLASKGILHQKTVPYSPEQNGKAEDAAGACHHFWKIGR